MIRRTFDITDITPLEAARYVVVKTSKWQSEFIHNLASEMNGWGLDNDGRQMFWINKDLSEKGRQFIKKLYEYTR